MAIGNTPSEPKTRTQMLAELRYQMRLILSSSDSLALRHGISAQQYQLLQAIAALSKEQQPSISFLAERMVLRHNSTVELVDRAARAGLVQREQDARDLRRSLVRLTPHGQDVLQTLVAEDLQELNSRSHDLIHALRELESSGAPLQNATPPVLATDA